MSRCLYGIIISLLLFNSVSTTAILVLFVVFTNQLLEKLETFPPMIDAKVNEIVESMNVDGKIDSATAHLNRMYTSAIDGTIDSVYGDFNETIGSLYQVKTSIHTIQEDIAYIRKRVGELDALGDLPT